MTQHVILNNIDHHALRVIPQQQTLMGNQLMCASLTLGELRDAQRDMPIVFHRDAANGQFCPMALLGLEKNENLFLSAQGWQGSYMPAVIEKGPFKIGHQQKTNGQQDLVISIDMDDPRVSLEQGEDLFKYHGGNSDFTQHIAARLHQLLSQRTVSEQFCQTLASLDLFETMSLEIELDAQQRLRLNGFYTLNEEKLAHSDGSILATLSQQGFLQGAYFCIASLSNITRLISLKQAQTKQSTVELTA